MAENIYEALSEVMKEVGYVQKQGSRNLNYTYAGEAALIAAIRPSFVEHGIVVMPIDVDAVDETYQTGRGATMNLAHVRVAYRFVHAPSQSHQDVVVRGTGADIGDKATAKAMTLAFKYALRQTLMIETGDDPDETPSEMQARKPKATKEPKKATPPQATNGKVDPNRLKKALGYKVPEGADIPNEGKSLEELQTDPEMGALILLWMAGEIKNHSNESFDAETYPKEAAAAMYVVSNSEAFKETRETFQKNNPELFA